MDDSVTRRGHPCWFRLPEVKLVKNDYKLRLIDEVSFLFSFLNVAEKVIFYLCSNLLLYFTFVYISLIILCIS